MLIVYITAGDGIFSGGQSIQLLPGNQTAMNALVQVFADPVAGGGILCLFFFVNAAALGILFFGHASKAHAIVEGTPTQVFGDCHVLQLLRGIPVSGGDRVCGQTGHLQKGGGIVCGGTAAHAAEIITIGPVFLCGFSVSGAVDVIELHSHLIYVIGAEHTAGENIPVLYAACGDLLNTATAANVQRQENTLGFHVMTQLLRYFPVAQIIACADNNVL